MSTLGTEADRSLSGSPPAGVRWLDQARGDEREPGARLIAPAGEGLWRVAPWPAADELFELPPAAGGDVILTGAETDLRDAIASGAAAGGMELDVVETLDAERLGRTACVVMTDAPEGALPARAFPVLAAGRLLLTPRLERSFGLEDGLDHLEFAGPDEAVTLLAAFVRNPAAFARVCSWARVKARPQRASVVYGRVADELGLGGAA